MRRSTLLTQHYTATLLLNELGVKLQKKLERFGAEDLCLLLKSI